MEDSSFFAPISKTYDLFKQPFALLCGLAMFAAQMVGNYLYAAISGPFPLGGHNLVPLIARGVTAGKLGVFALVFFLLARRLGGPKGSAGKPDMGIWIVLMLVYFLVTKLTQMIPPIFLRFDESNDILIPAVMSGTSLVVRLAYFPVMVFIAAAAHHGNLCRLSDVWSFLTSRGLNWYLCYALFGLAFAFVVFAMPFGLGTASGVPPRGGLFSIAFVGAAGQLFGIVFAIAAYRAVRWGDAETGVNA